MLNQVARILTACALIASLSAGSFAALAAPQTPQQQPEKPESKSATSSASTEQRPAASPTPQTNQKPLRPLSPDEDPRMIGKRNLNKGLLDKFSSSLEKEVALGRQLAAEIDREAKFVEDPIVTEYVNRVGQNVVLHSDAKIPFTIKVIESEELNAFALPGGFFYVNKGLLLAADNEAEIAGVMAHEIAHVTARHAVENQTKGMLAQIGLIAGSIFTSGILGAVLYNGANFGLLATFMKFSRGAESEADKLGAQYAYAAGYDPNSMSTMFEKLSARNKKKPGFISKAFSSHPQSVDRMQASRELVARFPERDEYVLNTSEFQRVKARLLRTSNAMKSAAGDIGVDKDGTSGRPTLKRRRPADDPTTPTVDSDEPKPSETNSSDPPKLRRKPVSTSSTSQPESTTP